VSAASPDEEPFALTQRKLEKQERQDEHMIVRTLAAAIVITGAFVALAASQQPGGAKPPAPPEPPKQQIPPDDAMHDDAMPGPIHKHMMECVGEYTTKTTFTMPGGPPPEESTGTAHLTMSLDGRFLVENGSGTMMGEPYQATKIYGYNNGTKEFEGVWMYTMSTGMMRLVGASTDHGKTVKWKGTYKEAAGEETLDIVTTHVDADSFTERLSHGEGGPVMETTYTRKK
jgi:hypothetical protein